MRSCITVILSVLPLSVNAVPPLDLAGHNDVGESVTVLGESGEVPHSEVIVRTKDKETELKGQRCGYSDDYTIFSCSPHGASSLAGTTYRFKAVAQDPRTVDCGRIAVCIRGCGAHTPHELLESGYECYDEAVCPNLQMKQNGSVSLRSTSGTVKGIGVNLRDNPHSQSRVLRTIAHGAELKVSEATGACWLVNGKPGVWVFVTVLDDNRPVTGWVFDAYIDYQTE